jgi:hypothetical protein
MEIGSPSTSFSHTRHISSSPATSSATCGWRAISGRSNRVVWCSRTGNHKHGPHEVWQTSTMGALIEGLYDGNVMYRDVMKHGDFGVGTFNALDGEMIALDGRFFRLRNDGRFTPGPATS